MGSLILDAHTGSWIGLYIENSTHKKKLRIKPRSGFYPYEWNFLFNRRDGRIQCSYCGEFLISRFITRDHVYPKSRGGEVTTPACYECNERKANKLPIVWALEFSMSESSNGKTADFQSANEGSIPFSDSIIEKIA